MKNDSVMRLDVLDGVDSSSWDAAVQKVGGIVEHSSAYARYVQAAEHNVRPRFFRWLSDASETVGVAVGYEAHSSRTLLPHLSSCLFLTTMPVVQPGCHEALVEFLDGIEDYARHSGVVRLEVGSSGTPGRGEPLETLRYKVLRRFEFELSLDKPEDDLWRAMEHKRRKNINKAKRMGVIIRDASDCQGICSLRGLQGDSSVRIVARGGKDITFKGDRDSDPVNVLLGSGLARIMCAELNNEVVSAGLFTCFNGLVYHTLSGHSNSALETQAPTLLLWETIRQFKSEGARRFNFGGCKAEASREGHSEHGIYEYKRAFGGEMLECTSGTKVLRRTRHWINRSIKGILGRT